MTSISFFISYSSNDADIAKTIEELAESRGIIVYRDENVMRSGGDWYKKMIPLIKKCNYFILIWSKTTSRSLPVTEELLHALRENKPIYPFLLDSSRPPLLNGDHQEYPCEKFDVPQFLEEIIPSSSFRPIGNQSLTAVLRSYKKMFNAQYCDFPILTLNRNQGFDQIINLKVDQDISEIEQDTLFKKPKRQVGKSSLDLSCIFNRTEKDGILLIGHPGAGKSTSLQYLAAILGKDNIDKNVGGVPILVKCSNYKPEIHFLFEDFIYASISNVFGHSIGNEMRTSGIAAYSETVLFIDGLDEIRTGAIDVFLTSLKNFLDDSEVKIKRVVLSTRYDGFRLNEGYFRDWDKLTLKPLEKEHIEKFIRNWFSDESQQNSLLFQISEPRLAELSQRPFLLALMCSLHDEGMTLGDNRSQLYHSAIKYLENRVKDAVSVEVRKQRRLVINNLAINMLRLGTLKIHTKLATTVVSLTLEKSINVSTLTEAECKMFLDKLSIDLGLIQRTTSGYTFVHRTFLEFLAAEKLHLDNNGIDGILEYASVPRWEEPIRLLIGLKDSVAEQTKIIEQLWGRNKALSLRSLTEAKPIDSSFVKALLRMTNKEDIVRMITSFNQSFVDMDYQTKRRLILETCAPILELVKENEILFYAIQQVREVDPKDSQRILWNNFGIHSKALRENLLNNHVMKFAFIEVAKGNFIMGDNNAKDAAEKPAHRVNLTSYKLMKYTLTNLAYEFITKIRKEKRDDNLVHDCQPVVALNWFDSWVTAFRIGCRLPTEAEWEYAARACSKTDWCFGDNLDVLPEYANFEGNARTLYNGPWEVGSGKENNFGFCDMHGNVWEWCSDWFGDYTNEEVSDPIGASKGTSKVRRGGGFAYHSRGCRSAFRWGNDPRYKFKDIGARFALSTRAINNGW